MRKLILTTIVLLVTAICAEAQQNPVRWSIKTSPPAGKVKAGDKITAQISASIDPGWYIYSITQGEGGPNPTRITAANAQPFKLAGAIRGPAPHRKMDENFGIMTETYSGNVGFTVPIAVAANASTGAQQLSIDVRYQVCNETICLPPKTVKLTSPVEIIASSATAQITPPASPSPAPTPKAPDTDANANVNEPTVAETANSNIDYGTGIGAISEDPPSGSTESTQQNAPEQTTVVSVNNANVTGDGMWTFVWLAIATGALTLLTPCVFPMVPITVSYFANHAEGRRSVAVRNALIFTIGIILTFTALGVALALLFGAAGINRFASSPWVNLAITGIFIAFALSLFGAYNLQMPSGLLTRLDSISRKKDSGKVIGLLLMGLVFSLTSFTCTAPFVGTLLVLAAQGEWIFPVIGMLAFSTVFALPFFVLALAPQLASQLPKSGGWMNSVKVVMGLLEIAAAMKFLSNVDLVWHWGIFTREVVLASWVAVAVLISVYLLGKFELIYDSAIQRIGALRLVTALVFLSSGFYLLTGLFGAKLGELESFLPPPTRDSTSAVFAAGRNIGTLTSNNELPWITNDYDAALKQAKAENKTVFIDFTGYTCTNCRWMEVNMFTRPQVREELTKYIRVRLYTDGDGEVYEKQQTMQQNQFGTVALPLYAVVNDDGHPVATFPGMTRDETEFLSFLKTGSDKVETASISTPEFFGIAESP